MVFLMKIKIFSKFLYKNCSNHRILLKPSLMITSYQIIILNEIRLEWWKGKKDTRLFSKFLHKNCSSGQIHLEPRLVVTCYKMVILMKIKFGRWKGKKRYKIFSKFLDKILKTVVFFLNLVWRKVTIKWCFWWKLRFFLNFLWKLF